MKEYYSAVIYNEKDWEKKTGKLLQNVNSSWYIQILFLHESYIYMIGWELEEM